VVPLPPKPTVEEEITSGDESEAEVEETVVTIVEHEDKIESTKIDALRDMLVGFLSADPSTKTVIFSQWTSFLNLLEPMLKREGIHFVRFDGSLIRKKRDAAGEILLSH
jgi:SWI/SNF-related matrix-associated actin-dependent regulator of chromatin subfamily A3